MYCSLAAFSLFCFVFTYFMIPETANKEIKDILKEILGTDDLSRSTITMT